METPILVAFVGLLGTIAAAALAYWSTKRREVEAEWRKEKIAHYKLFVEGLGGIVEGDATVEGHIAFARATNNLLLFAPQTVIEAANAFREEIRIGNANRSSVKHDELLAELILSIRRDVGVLPPDNKSSFRPMLWSSGVKTRLAVAPMRPNPSLEPTRYGRQCKPGLRYSVHCLSPGLHCPPPRAAQLER